MAKNVIDLRRKAYTEISMLSDKLTSSFTVGITPGRGTVMFSTIFPMFNVKFPNIKISLLESPVNELVKRIVDGKVDLGFLTSGFDDSEVESRKLLTEKFVMVVPRTHPLAHLAESAPAGDFATVELRQFQNDEFMLMGQGTTLRAIENEMFRDAGFEPKISFETASMQTINCLSRNGYGISFVPQFYANPTDQAVYFHIDPPVYWDLLAVHRVKYQITTPEEYLILLAKDFYKRTLHVPD